MKEAMNQFTFQDFSKKYPSSDACLQEIFKNKYVHGVFCKNCNKITKHFKLKNRNSYSCTYCRNQIFPTKGTIFEKSSVGLRLWFYAMFIMVNTRSGISAKQLERAIGVSYKTSHRIFKNIRIVMHDSNQEFDKNVSSTMSRGISGVYRHISPKFLDLYLSEYYWRYTNMNKNESMFEILLSQILRYKKE